MKISSQLLIFVSVLVAAGLGLSGCDLIAGQASAQTNSGQTANAPVADPYVISEGNLVPRDFIYLAFSMGGRVEEILVAKGDLVSEGQVLARLGNREQYVAQAAQAQLELTSSQQNHTDLVRLAALARAEQRQALVNARNAVIAAERAWDDFDTDDYDQDIDDARIRMNDLEDDVDEARTDFERYQDLAEDNATRKRYENAYQAAQDNYNEAAREYRELINQRDLAAAALENARAAEAEAERKDDAMQNGPDPDQLALAEARLANARAQLAAVEAAIDNLELKAPFAGTVVDINVVLNQELGSDTWALLIADMSEWYVETNDLTELEVVQVEPDEVVVLVPDALPEIEMTGRVVEIADVSRLQAGDVLYQVRIWVGEIDPRLRWGMTVEVRFDR